MSAATIDGLPGDAIGPGGSPLYLYVLYGESISRSLVQHARDVMTDGVLHRGIRLQQHARLEAIQ